MGPIAAVFDSNILIDYIVGRPQAAAELKRYSDKAISIITWMEVMAGTPEEEAHDMRAFLLQFQCLPISTSVAERAAALRRGRRLKLPDAVIQATAEVAGRLLITRNTRDFPTDDPGVRVPYRL